MAEPKVEQLYTLLKQWTAAEIMARLGALDTKKAVDFYQIMLNKKDEIRRLLYESDDLLMLGVRWGMLRNEKEQAEIDAKEKLEQRAQKLRAELATMDNEE